ncbi:MAG: hypothetical protein BGP13_12470 [Sphingobacteriales bacterium 40-81]|nr:MAG: hypothetical protein BGP13_12470 [Sphingobacteriales bacterium 40-81]
MTISAATIGLPVNLGASLEEVDSSTTVDNVFVFESGSKKWHIVFDGGITLYRTSWLNIGDPPTDKTSLFNIILSNADIKTIEVDTDIQLNGTINIGGRTLSIISTGKFSGTYTLQNAEISADLAQHIFDGTPTLTNCKSGFGKWYPTWFGSKGDGINNDYTAINNCIDTANNNSQKLVNLIPGNYLVESNITVPSGVTLQFEVGAKISGNVTISGTGNFDSKPHHIFDGVTVNGLYPLSGEITPQQFGTVGNNSTNDSPAFQKMWDYVATLSSGIVKILIPAKSYYIGQSVNLPKTATATRFIKVEGYGAVLRSNGDYPIWQRVVDSNAEATTVINGFICHISGLRFEGISSVASPLSNAFGLKIQSIYSWVFNDLIFNGCYYGIAAYFSLSSKFNNLRAGGTTRAAFLGRYGDWTGATRSNSAFNANEFNGCRVFNSNGSFTSLELIAADQTLVNNFISEGQNPQYNFYMDSENGTNVNINTFQNIWIESTGGVNTTNINFGFFRANSYIILKNIQRIYPNKLFFLDKNSNSQTIIIIDTIPYAGSLPASGFFDLDGDNNSGYRFEFKNLISETLVTTASNWDISTVPSTLKYEVMKTGGKITGVGGSNYLYIGNGAILINSSRGVGINYDPKVSDAGTGNQLHVANNNEILPSSIRGLNRTIIASGQNTGGNEISVISVNGSALAIPRFSCIRARGSFLSPLVVRDNDILSEYRGFGYDGSNPILGANIKFTVNGTPSTGIVPTKCEIATMNSSGSLQTVFTIRATGQIELPITPTTGTISDSILVRTSGGNLRQIPSTDLIGKSGSYSADGDSTENTFTVTHSFGSTPAQVLITPTNIDTAIAFYVTNKTSTTFDVVFTAAPVTGTGNVKFDWIVK